MLSPTTEQDEAERFAQLLSRTAGGDRDAFAELYRLSSARLFGVAMRIVKRTDIAEEVTQEAYIQVWKNAAAYLPDKGSPMAWLIGIVRFRALDRLRRDGADHVSGDMATTDAVSDPGPSPFEAAAGNAELRALLTCMERLEARQRDCLLQAYYEGCTHQELADRLEAPLGTVKSWIRRGLMSVRECLET